MEKKQRTKEKRIKDGIRKSNKKKSFVYFLIFFQCAHMKYICPFDHLTWWQWTHFDSQIWTHGKGRKYLRSIFLWINFFLLFDVHLRFQLKKQMTLNKFSFFYIFVVYFRPYLNILKLKWDCMIESNQKHLNAWNVNKCFIAATKFK